VSKLKYVLIFFGVIDISIFLLSQTAPETLVSLLPQFDVESVGNTYPRSIGAMFLMIGLVRLYGGLFIHQKSAFVLSIWSWVVELTHVVTEIMHAQFAVSENLVALVGAPLVLIWSLAYYRKNFMQQEAGP
jgi:hypothetical protein